jgi:nucleoside-diphosphate-sugar epimerase
VRVAVTGGSGFIGKCVVDHIRARGWEPIAPTRRDWRLGALLPPACDEADAVIHLASAVLRAKTNINAASALDLQATSLLLEQHRDLKRAGKRKKFIFVSSQSAREGARNNYGKCKWAIECLLEQEDEIVVRPGLVYDSKGSSVFGLFSALVKLPVVPVLSQKPCIQPIEVHELADALLRIVAAEQPQRCYKLGAPAALTFTEMIQAVAKRTGRQIVLVVSEYACRVRIAVAITNKLLPPVIGQATERGCGKNRLRGGAPVFQPLSKTWTLKRLIKIC